jgi:hypothetical protein
MHNPFPVSDNAASTNGVQEGFKRNERTKAVIPGQNFMLIG